MQDSGERVTGEQESKKEKRGEPKYQHEGTKKSGRILRDREQTRRGKGEGREGVRGAVK
jgi:hypothetical protein